MSLADWGRREIAIAEHEMPGLMAIRKEYAPGPAAQGRPDRRQLAHDDSDCEVLIETLQALGAEIRWVRLQYLLDARSCRRRHRGQGLLPVFAKKGETAGGIPGTTRTRF